MCGIGGGEFVLSIRAVYVPGGGGIVGPAGGVWLGGSTGLWECVGCGHSRGIWGWLWFSCGLARRGIGGVFILAGGLGAGPSFYGV